MKTLLLVLLELPSAIYTYYAPDGYFDDCPVNIKPYCPEGLELDPTTSVDLVCDDYMQYRNSFYWGPLQFSELSTTNPQSFIASDYLLARYRNWLHGSHNGTAIQGPTVVSHTLNMERAPSQDGKTPGEATWYGYYGKSIDDYIEGTNAFPSMVAKATPGYYVSGDFTYNYYSYNQFGEVTTNISSYGPQAPISGGGAAIGMRTNLYTYTNGIDLTSATILDGANIIVVESNPSQLISPNYH